MSYSRQTQLTRRRVYNDRGRGLWPRRRQSLDWTNISADADERKGRRRRPGLPGSAANKPIRARIYRSRPSSSREIAPSAGDRLTTRRQAALLLRPIPMQNSQPMTQKKKKERKEGKHGTKKNPIHRTRSLHFFAALHLEIESRARVRSFSFGPGRVPRDRNEVFLLNDGIFPALTTLCCLGLSFLTCVGFNSTWNVRCKESQCVRILI